MIVHILGPLEVRADGEALRISGVRQRKLLALLLLGANRSVAVSQLERELWEESPRTARQQIHNAIGSLRTTLSAVREDVRIVRVETGYRLDLGEGALDLHHFREGVRRAENLRTAGRTADAVRVLDTALALWRGTALEGLTGPVIEAAAAGLEEQRAAALETSTSWRLDVGDTAAVIGDLRRMVADHPLRETSRELLMRALEMSGRQAEALAVFDEGRRVLAEELGSDPGPRLRGRHEAILRGGDSAPVTASPEETPAPHAFLPRDIPDFSGRAKELAQLAGGPDGTMPEALVISAINGMGGVGKTTLAVHLGHQLARNYPDGQYFVDLHGFSPGLPPLQPEQALDALLRDSGVPLELLPADLRGRSALWRSRLAGKRVLLILDNAVDATHVRPLLPGTSDALVVVTSRRKLSALEGARSLSLDVLSLDEGRTMFTQVVGDSRTRGAEEEVAEAVELCGRLPLAIRIAAARLRDRASWTVADLVGRLRDQNQRRQFLQTGDRSVMAVLRVSYRYLPPERQRLFRLLSLIPGGDFEAHVAAALVGGSVDQVEGDLDELFDDNLLKQDKAGRYYFHDLVRDCAAQIASEVDDGEELTQARHRLFDYYLCAVREWSAGMENRIFRGDLRTKWTPQEIRPVRSTVEAVDVLDAEYHNLLAVAAYAADHGWHDHAWQFPCVLQPLLKLRNYGAGAYTLFEKGVRAARVTGDLSGESACLQGLAAVCREHRTVAEASTYLVEALALSRRLGDQAGQAAQLVDLGRLHLAEDRLDEARETFLAAEELTGKDTGAVLAAAISNNLGVINRDLGRYDEALDYLQKSLAITARGGFPHAAPLTTWSVGLVLHWRGDHEAAMAVFQRIREMSTAENFLHGEAIGLLGLSAVRRTLGDLDESLDLGRRSLTLARQLGLPKLECEVLNAVGESALAAGDLEHAHKVFDLAEERSRANSLSRQEARSLEGLAHVALANGKSAEAEAYWLRAEALYPPMIVDVQYIHRHLAALGNKVATSCFRCVSAEVVHPT